MSSITKQANEVNASGEA